MKIQCNIAKDLMPLYIDGVLTEDSKAAVEEHLTGCSSCRDYYRRMQDADLPGAEEAAEDVLQRLDEAERLRRLKKTIFIKRIATIAATAAAVIVLILTGTILVFHNPSYIPYEKAGLQVTEDGYLYVTKPYYCYEGAYYGKDAEGNSVEIFFLTSSYYSRHWEKPTKGVMHPVMQFGPGEESLYEDSLDKVYYLPEKYVKENDLDSFFSKHNSVFDQIYSKGLDEKETNQEINKLITRIEKEAPLLWSSK